MTDDGFELRWRKHGYTIEEQPKKPKAGRGKLRRRLTRAPSASDVAQGKAPASAGPDTKSRRHNRTGGSNVDPEHAAGITRKVRVPASGETSVASSCGQPSGKSGGHVSGGARTVGSLNLADRRQRCIVKVNYVRHGGGSAGSKSTGAGSANGGRAGAGGAAPLRAHARYLERDSAKASDPFGQSYLTRHGQDLFGRDGEHLKAWQADRHHFRLVISPENADQLDMKTFTTGFMQQLEHKLYHAKSASAPLEWVAVTHHNTDHPHAHVVLRGKTQDGSDLVIPKKTIALGLRELGRDLVTRELGYRLEAEIVRDLNRQVSRDRLTELDQAIIAKAQSFKQEKSAGDGLQVDPAGLDEHGRARIGWLINQGLARRTGTSAPVSLAIDIEDRLRARGEAHDIVRSMQRNSRVQEVGLDHEREHGSAVPASEQPSPLQRYRKCLAIPPLAGHICHLEPLDELTDRFGAVIQDAAGKTWLVELSHGQAELLSVGDRVRVTTTRSLPGGRTIRTPFIRFETLVPARAATIAPSPGVAGTGPIQAASRAFSADSPAKAPAIGRKVIKQPSRGKRRGMGLDID